MFDKIMRLAVALKKIGIPGPAIQLIFPVLRPANIWEITGFRANITGLKIAPTHR
jgi:hypothetical protein